MFEGHEGGRGRDDRHIHTRTHRERDRRALCLTKCRFTWWKGKEKSRPILWRARGTSEGNDCRSHFRQQGSHGARGGVRGRTRLRGLRSNLGAPWCKQRRCGARRGGRARTHVPGEFRDSAVSLSLSVFCCFIFLTRARRFDDPSRQDYLDKDTDGDCGRGKPFWSSVLALLSFGRHRPLFPFCVPVGRKYPARG